MKTRAKLECHKNLAQCLQKIQIKSNRKRNLISNILLLIGLGHTDTIDFHLKASGLLLLHTKMFHKQK